MYAKTFSHYKLDDLGKKLCHCKVICVMDVYNRDQKIKLHSHSPKLYGLINDTVLFKSFVHIQSHECVFLVFQDSLPFITCCMCIVFGVADQNVINGLFVWYLTSDNLFKLDGN